MKSKPRRRQLPSRQAAGSTQPAPPPRERIHDEFLEDRAFDAHAHGEAIRTPDVDLVGTPTRARESIAAEEPSS